MSDKYVNREAHEGRKEILLDLAYFTLSLVPPVIC
jgi:hypothetical protein